MATFSTNQVRQLYVVNKWDNSPSKIYNAATGEVLSTAVAGEMAVMKSRNVRTNINEFQFVSTNVDNELQITDRIPLTQIRSIRVKGPQAIINPLIGFSNFGTYTDGANTITWVNGTQLCFTITFPEFIGISPEDTFSKTICVTYNESGTPNDYVSDLAHALDLAFKHEPKFDIAINPTAGAGVDLIFKPTHFRLGIASQKLYRFWISNVHVFYLDNNGNRHNYYFSKSEISNTTNGLLMDNRYTATTPTLDYITANSNDYADLEWFCMGERGDMYRMKGWPNYIETRYMVNPNHRYTAIDIHYYFKDEGVSGYPSEKIITLLVDEGQWNITLDSDPTWAELTVALENAGKHNSADNGILGADGLSSVGVTSSDIVEDNSPVPIPQPHD